MTPGSGLSSQMISGPDLGAGFLHQLSMDGEADPRMFTYHAQDGGADAAGPPKGPPDVLGFVHPPTPCMFGGPRCWHRAFSAPHAELPKVRLAYNRNRFVLQAMVDQVYAGAVADVDGALRLLLAQVAGPLEEEGIPWFVGGSTAVWLQGGAVQPRDIDLGTNREGVDRIGKLLAPYLIEPVALTEWAFVGPVRAARAFVGTFEKGARVEWGVPVGPRPSNPSSEFGVEPERVRTEVVRFENRQLKVGRLEYGLVRAAEKGRGPMVREIARLLRARGPDLDFLDALLAGSSASAAVRRSVLESVRG